MTSTQTITEGLTKVPRNLNINALKEQKRLEDMSKTVKVEPKSFQSVPATGKSIYLTDYKNGSINVVKQEESKIKNYSMGLASAQSAAESGFYKPSVSKSETKVETKLWPIPEKDYKMVQDMDELTSNITVDDITKANLTYAYGSANTQIDLPMDKEHKYLLKGRNQVELRPIPNYVPLGLSQRGGLYGLDRVKYNEEIVRKNAVRAKNI